MSYRPGWHYHHNGLIFAPPANDPNGWGGCVVFDSQDVDCDEDCKDRSEDEDEVAALTLGHITKEQSHAQ